MTKKKIVSIVAVLALVLVFLVFALPAVADDVDPTDPGCVPRDAYSETIEVPAVTHEEVVVDVPGTPAVDAVAGFWKEFSPNKEQGPFDGPPSYPTDPRGTWSDEKENGGPQQDASGVFHNGNGNGSWFYRSQGTPGSPAVPDTYKTIIVVDVPASTETIEHPAVVCETDPPVENNGLYAEYEIKADCDTPLIDWIIPTPNDRYTVVDVYETGPYNYEIKYITDGDFIFFESGTHETIEQVALPVLNCGKPTVETDCSPTRCIKIETDSSGKETKTVIRYDNPVEEGL